MFHLSSGWFDDARRTIALVRDSLPSQQKTKPAKHQCVLRVRETGVKNVLLIGRSAVAFCCCGWAAQCCCCAGCSACAPRIFITRNLRSRNKHMCAFVYIFSSRTRAPAHRAQIIAHKSLVVVVVVCCLQNASRIYIL